MENKQFNSVFEGLEKAIQEINEQKESFINLNNELKNEIKKTKRYNVFMLILAIGSFIATLIFGMCL